MLSVEAELASAFPLPHELEDLQLLASNRICNSSPSASSLRKLWRLEERSTLGDGRSSPCMNTLWTLIMMRYVHCRVPYTRESTPWSSLQSNDLLRRAVSRMIIGLNMCRSASFRIQGPASMRYQHGLPRWLSIHTKGCFGRGMSM